MTLMLTFNAFERAFVKGIGFAELWSFSQLFFSFIVSHCGTLILVLHLICKIVTLTLTIDCLSADR